jgi:ubiquinone/menaquinone biosynthesis C-methylase UbiE
MKLNLASGTDLKPFPWINLDIVPRWPNTTRGCDVIWDARKDKIPFADNSADEIYASYLLLHLAPRFHKQVLSEMWRVLTTDGILVVGEVDMRETMMRFLNDPYNPGLSDLIWGEQGICSTWPEDQAEKLADFDKHCQGFTEESLKKTLSDAGFSGFNKIKLHAAEVFYELTLTCKKVMK